MLALWRRALWNCEVKFEKLAPTLTGTLFRRAFSKVFCAGIFEFSEFICTILSACSAISTALNCTCISVRPSCLSLKKSGLRRILFHKSCLRHILFIQNLACGAYCHEFSLKQECIWFEVSESAICRVYKFIGGENDASSNTEWSQQFSFFQTVIMKLSNNKHFVLRYKSHNIISIQKQFVTNMYSRGNASPKAYRFWRLEIARSVQATSLSRQTQLFVHSHARRRLRANTSRRIKRCSGWYHPRRYRLQRFRTATARCTCTPNAKSCTRWLLWIFTEPV